MEYYYTPKEFIQNDKLIITDDEAKHLDKVLRKKSGEDILVTDGEGTLYKVTIDSVKKNSVSCSIISRESAAGESPVNITLYQSLLKNPDRFEFVIEKSVELGVNKIVPLVTHNVINKSKDKTERWQSIALSAMKQSQRCYLPKVTSPIEFIDAVKTDPDNIKLIAHEKSSELENPDLKFNSNQSVSLFIGPEGGFTDYEIRIANEHDFKTLSFGKRKFRSETAAILAIGLLLYNH